MNTNETCPDSTSGDDDPTERLPATAPQHVEPNPALPLEPAVRDEITHARAAVETAHQEAIRRRAEAEEAERLRAAALAEVVALLPAVREVLRRAAKPEGDNPPPNPPPPPPS